MLCFLLFDLFLFPFQGVCFLITVQRYGAFFLFPNFFLTFFHFWRLDLPTITNFVFMLSRVPPFSGAGVPAVCWSCVRWSPDNHMHAYTYARIYARARGFLDYKFLDSIVIFRLSPYRNFWSTNGNF